MGKVSVNSYCEFDPLIEFFHSIKNVTEGYDGKGDYHQITLLAEEIKKDDYFQQYLIKETDAPANSKVLITLNHIAKGRLKYCKHWNNYAHIAVIQSLLIEMNQIYAMWNTTVKLFIRLFFDKNEKSIRENIYEQLIKISDAEKKACLDALKECDFWIGDEVKHNANQNIANGCV